MGGDKKRHFGRRKSIPIGAIAPPSWRWLGTYVKGSVVRRLLLLVGMLIAEQLKVDEEFNWREFADKGDFSANAAQSVAGYTTWKSFGAAEAHRKIIAKGWNERVSGNQELFFSGDCSELLAKMAPKDNR